MITIDLLVEAAIATRTHGTRGELQVDVLIEPEFFTPGRCLVIEIDGIFVPFFINGVRPKGTMLLITFDDFDTAEKAKAITGKTLYALSRDIPESELNDNTIRIDDLTGFQVIDSEHGHVGEVARVDYSTANALLILATPDNCDLFIPAAEGIVSEIDVDSKKIHVNLPEGLIDLNK